MPELKIIPIGPYVLDEMHQINTFFIITKTYKILYDLVPIQFYEKFREELMSQSKIEEIDYLVLSNSHSSILNVMEKLIQDGFKGVIISNHFFSRQIENVYQNIQVKSLKSLDFILMDGKEVVFEFIPVVFLPYPKMFLSYMPLTETLFSNTIFSSYIHLDDPDNPWFGFDRFHENMMPSSHFLHIPLRLIKEKRIQTIYPLYGKGYEIYEIDQVLEHLHSLQFYNQSQPYEEEGGLRRIYDFTDALNDMQVQLKNHFSKQEILDCFSDSKITFDQDTLWFNASELVGYALWNHYFEHIYLKKGILWLSILEKTIYKYSSDYHLPKPMIYESEVVKNDLKAQNLGIEKEELEKRIDALNQAIKESKDLSIKSKTTGLYLQSVLREMMKKRLEDYNTNYYFGLMLIQIDQLNEINHQYGKKAGDEALRTLAYLIEQLKDDACLMFRQSGPGIIVYKHDATLEMLEKAALMIKNAIQSSVLFIDKVTVSISIATSDEMKDLANHDLKIQSVFDILEKRMAIAKRIGYGEIVSQKSENVHYLEGLILIVDEDKLSQNMMIRIFHRIDYEVIVASSVSEAMEIIQEKPIDVVISEINLSKLDGFELKRLMNESIYRNMPFLMVSHNKTIENIKRGNALGVDLILEKPVVMDEIIGLVKRFKERKIKI
ncbi:MAG: response regulator [Candidatus Izemoplasmatales bacterium]|nr:response regulator [Candidatus Izemoplasmatales bacterium]